MRPEVVSASLVMASHWACELMHTLVVQKLDPSGHAGALFSHWQASDGSLTRPHTLFVHWPSLQKALGQRTGVYTQPVEGLQLAVLHGGAGPVIPEDDELAASLDELVADALAKVVEPCEAVVVFIPVVDEASVVLMPVVPAPPVLGPNWKSG